MKMTKDLPGPYVCLAVSSHDTTVKYCSDALASTGDCYIDGCDATGSTVSHGERGEDTTPCALGADEVLRAILTRNSLSQVRQGVAKDGFPLCSPALHRKSP